MESSQALPSIGSFALAAAAVAGDGGGGSAKVPRRTDPAPTTEGTAAEQTTRERIMALLQGRAWTARELGEVLGVDRKTADYHLHQLRRQRLVVQRTVHGERRYTLASGAPTAFASAEPVRTRYRLALIVEQRGMVGLDALARELKVSKSLAAYHVRCLAREDIVRVRRQGQRVIVQAKGLAVQALDMAGC